MKMYLVTCVYQLKLYNKEYEKNLKMYVTVQKYMFSKIQIVKMGSS